MYKEIKNKTERLSRVLENIKRKILRLNFQMQYISLSAHQMTVKRKLVDWKYVKRKQQRGQRDKKDGNAVKSHRDLLHVVK